MQWPDTARKTIEPNKVQTENPSSLPEVRQPEQTTASSTTLVQDSSKPAASFVPTSTVQSPQHQTDAELGKVNTNTPSSTITAPNSSTLSQMETLLGKPNNPLIVQPESTLDEQDRVRPVDIENGKIFATPEKIMEIAEIRDEIKDAIVHDEYAVSSSGKSSTTASTPTLLPDLFSIIKQFSAEPAKPIVQPEGTTKPKEKAIIVQPESTIDTNDIPADANKTTIAATPEKMREAAEIRKEINDAVAHNEYAIPSPEKPGLFETLSQLLGNEKKENSTSNKTNEEIVGDSRSDFSFVTENTNTPLPSSEKPTVVSIVSPPTETDLKVEALTNRLIEDSKQESSSKIVPNFVDSEKTVSSSRFPPMIPNRSKNLRDILTINFVRENPNFQIGNGVFAWKTLQRNTKSKHALIGLTLTGVVLVYEENSEYKIKKEIPLFSAPSCLTTFTRWNSVNSTIEGIVVVGTQKELVFLVVNEQMTDMDVFLLFPISKPVAAIEYFQIDHVDMLVLINSNSFQNSADLYRFNLNTKNYWLLQGIQLRAAADNLVYLHTGYDHLLGFPQNNSAIIYRFSGGRFIYYTELPMENSKTISAFEMGGYAYLAIGGDKPVIMRYQNGNFHAQTILAKGWGTVEHFLPISARTYRDDLIVLVQHRINFDSHSISVIEALVWNGEAFDSALAIPCYTNNNTSINHGLECMIDFERELGIEGATVIQHSKYLTVLVPRHEAPSGLYDFDVELKPVTIESLDNDASLYALFAEVIEYLKIHENLFRNGTETLKTVNNNELLSLKNIDTINAESVAVNENVRIETIRLGEELLTQDSIERIVEFENVLNETLKITEELDKITQNSRRTRQTESLHIEKLRVNNLNVEYFNDVPAKDLVFIENGSLRLKGPLMLENGLEAEQVQVLPDEVVGSEQPMNLDETIPELRISGNLNFDVINGIPWNVLLQEIVFINSPNHLQDVEINGVSKTLS